MYNKIVKFKYVHSGLSIAQQSKPDRSHIAARPIIISTFSGRVMPSAPRLGCARSAGDRNQPRDAT